MGRTLTEDYLGDNLQIIMRRVRTSEGVLEWEMRVTFETYDDPAGLLVFNEALDNVLAMLTANQRTSAIAFANMIRDRLATFLNVAAEKPA